MARKYFEIEFSNDNTIDRSIEGCDDDYSICIVGIRHPSIEEAESFCNSDMENLNYKCIVSITEITKDEAFSFFNIKK